MGIQNQFRTTQLILLGAFMLTTILYALFQTKGIVSGPTIDLEYPTEGLRSTERLVTLRGTIRNAAHITLNGKTIFTNERGAVDEPLLLADGYNILEVTAADKFRRETTKLLHIVYNAKKSS